MPLPMKTLREAAAELGMSEAELRTLIDLHKVRAIWKKGQLALAPDEIARLRRQRKTLESALRPGTTPPAAPKAAPPKPAATKPAAPKPAPPRATVPKPALKLPTPPAENG